MILARLAAAGSMYPAVQKMFDAAAWSGNGSTQNITSQIDLSTSSYGILTKQRSGSGIAQANSWTTTTGGPPGTANPLAASVAVSDTNGVTATLSNGYTVGSSTNTNGSSRNYLGWAFRAQAGFFEWQRYSNAGFTRSSFSHTLGVVPGMVWIKRTDSTNGWFCWHRSLPTNAYLRPNTTDAAGTDSSFFGGSNPTSTDVLLGSHIDVNASSGDYEAMLWAHDDGFCKCSSVATNGSGNATVELGWEPQALLIKNTTSAGGWIMLDTARGWTASGGVSIELQGTATENAADTTITRSGSGFSIVGGSASATYVYMAIRKDQA